MNLVAPHTLSWAVSQDDLLRRSDFRHTFTVIYILAGTENSRLPAGEKDH
jgi:hypothetical protein